MHDPVFAGPIVPDGLKRLWFLTEQPFPIETTLALTQNLRMDYVPDTLLQSLLAPATRPGFCWSKPIPIYSSRGRCGFSPRKLPYSFRTPAPSLAFAVLGIERQAGESALGLREMSRVRCDDDLGFLMP